MTLVKSAVGGASVTLLGQSVRMVLQLCSTVILARLLVPEDFGLVAVVVAAFGIGEVLRDVGLSMAIVRARTISQGQSNNLFWLNLLLGLILTVVSFFASPLLGDIFGRVEVVPIAQALAITFVLNGISVQFRAHVNRDLRFTALAIIDTVSVAIGFIGAISIAAVTHSFWALVWQQILTAVAGVVLAAAFARWAPGLPSRKESVREFLKFGGGILGTQTLAYTTRNIDTIALGLTAGPVATGVYSRAYSLLMVPLNQIAAPLTRVAVPVLSRIDDDALFVRYLKKSQVVGGFGIVVLFSAAGGLAGTLVPLLFGPGWSSMVPVFQALAVGGTFRALNQVSFWAFLARGYSGAQFRFALVSQPVIVLCMMAGLPWGALGVAVGHSVGYFAAFISAIWWCARVTRLPLWPLAGSALRTVCEVGLPVVGVTLLCDIFVPNSYAAVGAGLVSTVSVIAIVSIFDKTVREHLQTIWGAAHQLRHR